MRFDDIYAVCIYMYTNTVNSYYQVIKNSLLPNNESQQMAASLLVF